MSRENIRFYSSIIATGLMIILAPLYAWSLTRTVDHGERITAIEAVSGMPDKAPQWLIDEFKEVKKQLNSVQVEIAKINTRAESNDENKN